MRAVRLIARRAHARGSLLVSLFSVAAIAVFLLSGMAGYLAGTADAAVRDTVGEGPAKSVAVQLSTRLAPDRTGQADAVGRLIDDAFRGVEVAVHRTVRSNPVAATIGDQQASVILAADDKLAEHAKLVSGAWPAPGDLGTATMQAAAAAELGIEPGDEFTVEVARFVLVGTWHPVDASSSYWFADPATASGFDGSSVGPVTVAEATLADLPVRSYAQWTVVPTATALTAEALPPLAAALDDLAAGVERADSDQAIELHGTLADRIGTVQRGVGVAGALATVPAVLISVIAAIAVAQLARLLVAVRRAETALLRARGASVTQLTVVSLIEAVAVIVLGSGLGAALVIALLATGLIPLNVPAMAGAVWPAALAAATAGVLLCAVVCWRGARAAAGPAHGDSGRTRATVTIGATVLVLVAAGVSVAQFKLYGSPLVAGPDGDLRVDPVIVAAPALMLLSLAVLAVASFAPVARLLERWAGTGRGILPALPARQVARRVSVFGVALLLITLAVSGTTLTAVYSQTGAAAGEASARLGNGADVRVQLSPPATVEGPASLVTSVPYLRLPGVEDAATVLKTSARIADDTVGLTAMAASRMPTVMAAVDGSVDPEFLAATLQSEPSGLPLRDADELALTVQVGGDSRDSPGTVEAFSWLEDADGSLARVSHGVTTIAAAAAGPVTLAAATPEGRAGAWKLLAVEATLAGAAGSAGLEVTIDGLGRDLTLTLSSTDPSARAVTYPDPQNLPILVTEALATRLSLTTGGPVTMRIPSTASPVNAVVAGSTPALPAEIGRLALIADLPALNRYLLSTSDRIPQLGEVWISGAADSALVDAAVAVSRSSATVTTAADAPAERLTQPAIVALWWGAAGSLLLAAIAVLAITATFSGDRRGEVLVLRALGLSSAEQGRNRLIEVVTVAGAGLVAGVFAGLVTAALTAGELASTAGGAVPVTLRFDVLGWLALVFALVAILLTISLGYAGTVSRQARDTEYRGETQ